MLSGGAGMSFSSPPERPEIELVVERLADGEVSPYLTDVLRAGDLLVDDLIGRDELDHQPATVEVNLRACWQMLLVVFTPGVTAGSDLVTVACRAGARGGSWYWRSNQL
ncbi:MAG: hypothetical protein ACRDQU_01130, partial [Pseudonocardiaceae bacterium]